MFFALVALVIFTSIMLLRGSANRLFYYPSQASFGSPSQVGLAFEEFFFSSADGTRLHAWFIPAQGDALGTVIQYHGNAENMSSHFSYVDWVPAQGFNLVTFDYRGYGQSAGRPTRKGTVVDGQAILKAVRSRPDLDPSKILILGQSLGGAVSLAAVAEGDREGVCGIAVDSTFVSYQGVALDIYSKLHSMRAIMGPIIRWVVTEEHSPLQSLSKLQGIPLLILHGDKDEIVPYGQAQKLFQAAPEPRKLLTVPGGFHTDALVGPQAETYRKALTDFYKDCLNR